jgi:hypothetical protein
MEIIKHLAAFGLLLSAGTAWAQDPARTIEGRLDNTDPQVDGHSHFDEHRISLAAGQRVAITVTTEAFDPVAELYRPGGVSPIARNDDDGTSLNSRLVVSAPAAGNYMLRVLSFGGDRMGAYTVGITPLAPLPTPVTAHSSTETRSWRVFQGEITAEDESQGRRFDDYQITLRQGELALIRADSTAIDPLVEVMAAAERDGPAMATDDDSGVGLGSLIAFEAPLNGDYIVRVYSLNPEGTGAYTLRIGD